VESKNTSIQLYFTGDTDNFGSSDMDVYCVSCRDKYDDTADSKKKDGLQTLFPARTPPAGFAMPKEPFLNTASSGS
jgi:hypothetical protein